MQSTYLYIKKHKDTGLMYFGKTIRKDVSNYTGSGIYWNRHLKEHGNNVNTIWCEKFVDKNDLIEFSEFFSDMFDIVKSKLWANLVPENGIMGGNIRKGSTLTEETKQKIRLSRTGQKATPETRKKMSDSKIGKNYNSKENVEKLISYNKTRIFPKKLRAILQSKIECEHCGKIGGFLVMHKTHMKNCKKIKEN